MKANEAPEKLYFGEVDKGVLDIYSNRESNDEIEYTRTDVFLHKACSWLKENKDKYLYNTGERDEYIPTCSGKMIEDFKDYLQNESEMPKKP